MSVLGITLLAVACGAVEEPAIGPCQSVEGVATGELAQDIVGSWGQEEDGEVAILRFAQDHSWSFAQKVGDAWVLSCGTYAVSGDAVRLESGARQATHRVEVLDDTLSVWIDHDSAPPMAFGRVRCPSSHSESDYPLVAPQRPSSVETTHAADDSAAPTAGVLAGPDACAPPWSSAYLSRAPP